MKSNIKISIKIEVEPSNIKADKYKLIDFQNECMNVVKKLATSNIFKNGFKLKTITLSESDIKDKVNSTVKKQKEIAKLKTMQIDYEAKVTI